jgi:RNA polymerase sigma-70 factor (family 1)
MVKNSYSNDKELLFRLKASDQTALALLYQKYWQPLYLSSFNILRDHQICEDIIQELFITVWNKREDIQVKTSLKAYLHASVRYEVFRQIRHGAGREDIFENIHERLQTPEEYGSIEHKELAGQIKAAVDVLPDKCRQVFKLSREEQLSHKEIAHQLHISTKTVENHLNKALRQLRNALTFFI